MTQLRSRRIQTDRLQASKYALNYKLEFISTILEPRGLKIMKKTIFFILMLVHQAALGANYDYNKLRFMKYNQLRQIKNSAVSTSRKYSYPRQAEQAIKPLQETLIMLLSRPNEDNLASALITDLESELETLNVYEQTVQNIIDDRLEVITNKKLASDVRTTAALSIKNLLLEIKPKTLSNVELAKVVCKLADKNIKIPKDIQKSSMFKSLYLEKSPSKVAQKIMLWYAKEKKINVNAQVNSCPFSKRAI